MDQKLRDAIVEVLDLADRSDASFHSSAPSIVREYLETLEAKWDCFSIQIRLTSAGNEIVAPVDVAVELLVGDGLTIAELKGMVNNVASNARDYIAKEYPDADATIDY